MTVLEFIENDQELDKKQKNKIKYNSDKKVLKENVMDGGNDMWLADVFMMEIADVHKAVEEFDKQNKNIKR